MLSREVMYAIAAMEGVPDDGRDLWFQDIRDELRDMDSLTAIIAAPYVVQWYTRIARDNRRDWKRPFTHASKETEIEKFERGTRGIGPAEDRVGEG